MRLCKAMPYDNVASYYGLKTFQNGKTYYFDKDYKMAKGWKRVSGGWYFFNDYGTAVVKCRKQSGGKRFYLQFDSAMYANRYPSDGHWANGSGVWVK